MHGETGRGAAEATASDSKTVFCAHPQRADGTGGLWQFPCVSVCVKAGSVMWSRAPLATANVLAASGRIGLEA